MKQDLVIHCSLGLYVFFGRSEQHVVITKGLETYVCGFWRAVTLPEEV
mgnify:CR=1 FL=1